MLYNFQNMDIFIGIISKSYVKCNIHILKITRINTWINNNTRKYA